MATPAELAALKSEVRKELWATRKSAHEEYDRALLTLASGGLALSVTLVKDMFPLDKVVTPSLLLASWFFFAAAILVVITSFLLSQYVHNIAIKRLDSTPPSPPPTHTSNIIVVLNWLAGGMFVAGVVIMTLFAANNFNKRLSIAQEEAKKNQISGNTPNANVSGAVRAVCAGCCRGATFTRPRGTGTTATFCTASSAGGKVKAVVSVKTGVTEK